jgi:hypothetical protein
MSSSVTLKICLRHLYTLQVASTTSSSQFMSLKTIIKEIQRPIKKSEVSIKCKCKSQSISRKVAGFFGAEP